MAPCERVHVGLSQAVEVPKRRGLDRYIKKKAKAPLETYVPAVLEARNQMLKAGEVMGAAVSTAIACVRTLVDLVRALPSI